MHKKILIGGVTAAAIIGAGGTALAATGSDTPGAANATASTAKQHAKGRHERGLLGHLEHGQFVTKSKTGTVTHNLIRGTVTAVSASSISVRAADKTTETFVVTKDTKVRVRQDGKGATSTIDKVATGDRVFVSGTGTSTLTAKHVIDSKGKAAK